LHFSIISRFSAAVKNQPSAPTMNDFERDRYSNEECVDAFRELFPRGFAAEDVIAEIAPDGWDRSPLVAIFHPSLEQVFQEAVDSHQNIQELCQLFAGISTCPGAPGARSPAAVG